MKYLSSTILGLILLCVTGCGDGRPPLPPTYPVKGTVTLDNVPVSEGVITFVPEKLDGRSVESGPIKDGTFDTRARAGKMKVEIRSSRKAAEKPVDSQPVPEIEIIPAQFNANTTLTVEVSATGTNEFKFDLKK